jgi:signal transduction histidine kinase
MSPKWGIRQRLIRAFVLQVVLIGMTAVIGVYAASLMIKDLLITRALKEEASYFQNLRQSDPATGLPDTRNLTGYLEGSDKPPPEQYVAYGPGFHDLPSDYDFTTLYVSEVEGKRLYLVFDGESVGRLALYFGLIPLTLVLVALYLAALVAWRMASRAISPLLWLAREVDRFDPDPKANNLITADEIPAGTDREVLALTIALNNLNERIRSFVEREHQFTRDASHELRSPLTVIKIAADMLLSEQDLPAQALKSVNRIQRNAGDMEDLMEALLLLAREAELGLSLDQVYVNDIVDEEVDRNRSSIREKGLEVNIVHHRRLRVEASAKAMSMMFGNLLRNAINYTEHGSIDITVDAGGVTIEDSGIGMDKEQLEKVFTTYYRATGSVQPGHGVGLSIVKRLSDRFNWPVEMSSQPEEGTRVHVSFPGGICEP